MSDTMKGLLVLIVLGVAWIPVVWQIWVEVTAPPQNAPASPMSPRERKLREDARSIAREHFWDSAFSGIMMIVFAIIGFALFIAMLKLIVWLVI